MNPLDLRGPQFLFLYGLLLLLVVLVTLSLRAWKISRHENGIPVIQEDDPLNLAILAGGRQRLMLTVLSLLYSMGSISIRRLDQQWRCIAGNRPNTEIKDVLAVWEEAREFGDQGCGLDSIFSTLQPYVQKRENKLALLGLRPVFSDQLRIRMTGTLLFIGLIALGIAKVAVGLDRQKPVGFLVVGLILTGIIWKFLIQHAPKLTPKGEELLQSHMTSNPRIDLKYKLNSITQPISDEERVMLLGAGVAMYSIRLAKEVGYYELTELFKNNLDYLKTESGLFSSGSGRSSGSGSFFGCGGDAGCGGGGGCGGGCGGCGGD